MPRAVSLTTRYAMQAQQTAEVAVMLATITHPALPQPVRLSSDPTVRLSVEPLAYGTKSQGQTFSFVLMGAVLPDSQADAPPKTTLVLDNVGSDMVAALRSITSPASIDLAVVSASTPDVIEAAFNKLRAVRSSYSAGQISLDISREPWTSEPMPAGRMTRDRFPGLH